MKMASVLEVKLNIDVLVLTMESRLLRPKVVTWDFIALSEVISTLFS